MPSHFGTTRTAQTHMLHSSSNRLPCGSDQDVADHVLHPYNGQAGPATTRGLTAAPPPPAGAALRAARPRRTRRWRWTCRWGACTSQLAPLLTAALATSPATLAPLRPGCAAARAWSEPLGQADTIQRASCAACDQRRTFACPSLPALSVVRCTAANITLRPTRL